MSSRLPPITFVETPRGYRLEIGRFALNQSSFLLVAAVIVGLGGGYGAVAFRWLISAAQTLAFGYLAPALHVLGPANVIVVLVLGGVATALFVERFAKEARGHGVPEVMAAVALEGGIMHPRVIAVKSLASAICIGFGGSVGREGPIVQIGSEDTLEECAIALSDPATPLLPVVDAASGSLLGIITRRDVLLAYSSRVDL